MSAEHLVNGFAKQPVGSLFYVKGRIGWRNLRHSDFTTEGPYLITGMHIDKMGKVEWSRCFRIPEKKYNESPDIAVRTSDIIITKDGTIGKVAYIDELPGPTSLNSHLFLVRADTSAVVPSYAKHVFLGAAFKQFIEDQKTGSTIVGLPEARFRKFAFPVPPLPEQRRIAVILDTLDRTIEATQRIVSKLQAARQGLLHDLLTRGLDEQGQLRDPQRHPEQFKDTVLGRMPVGWEVRPVGDSLLRIEAGHSPSCPERPAEGKQWGVLKVSAVHPDGFKARENKVVLSDKLHNRALEVQDGDILITRANTSELVGLVCQVHQPPQRLMISDKTLRLVFQRHVILPEFFNLIAGVGHFRGAVRDAATGSSAGMKNISQQSLVSILVAIPGSIDEQRFIAEVAGKSYQKIKAEQAQLAKLQTLKRGLMEDLLTGRVRVAGAGRGFEDKDAGAAVQPVTAELPSSGPLPMPPPLPAAPQHRAMYRAGAGASPEAMSEWTQQLWDAAQGQQVGPYSHAALDAVLPQLAAASSERAGVERIPELLAGAGVRFILLPHPRGSKASGAAFYLNEERTQPVVGLSLRYPLLDVFWFNLFHELGHIRLGHQPVLEEVLDSDSPDPKSPDEQAADAFAREQLIPEAVWQPFLKGGQHDSNRIKRLARGLNRHPATVAGRLAFDTHDWRRFNAPELRPNIEPELRALMAQLGTMREPRDP